MPKKKKRLFLRRPKNKGAPSIEARAALRKNRRLLHNMSVQKTAVCIEEGASEEDSQESDSDVPSDAATNHSESGDSKDFDWDDEQDLLNLCYSEEFDSCAKDDLFFRYNVLANENKEIKRELSSLRENLSLLKDIPTLVSTVRELISELKIAQCEVSRLRDELDKASQVYKGIDAAASIKCGKQAINEEKDILSADHTTEIMSCPNDTNISSPPTSAFQDSSNNIISVHQTCRNNKSGDLPVTPVMVQPHPREQSAREYVSFAGKKVPKDRLELLSHKKVSILAGDLCMMVYTPEEMALCSISGRKSNAHKYSFPKKPLDPSRLEAIIDYVLHSSGLERRYVQHEVIKAVKVKLGNFLKTDEAKKIISAHMESLGLQSPITAPVVHCTRTIACRYQPNQVTQEAVPCTAQSQSVLPGSLDSLPAANNFASINQKQGPPTQISSQSTKNFSVCKKKPESVFQAASQSAKIPATETTSPSTQDFAAVIEEPQLLHQSSKAAIIPQKRSSINPDVFVIE